MCVCVLVNSQLLVLVVCVCVSIHITRHIFAQVHDDAAAAAYMVRVNTMPFYTNITYTLSILYYNIIQYIHMYVKRVCKSHMYIKNLYLMPAYMTTVCSLGI